MKICPKNLTIIGVISTSISLFITVVQDGNSGPGKGPGDGVLETVFVAVGVEEAGVVVIVHEVAEEADVLEEIFLGV